MSERQIAWLVVVIGIVGAIFLSVMGAWGAGWLIFIAFIVALGLVA